MVLYHDRNLIINYIPKCVTDAELTSLFSFAGPVKTCRIIRDRNNGFSFGFGFCEYEDADSALRAITNFNGYRIADKVLKVSMAKLQGKLSQSSNLYVRNFPVSVTEEQLSSEFQKYGKVIQCRILRDRETDLSKGSAYVLYDNRLHAEAAKKSLDGFSWPGYVESHIISIKFATPPYRQPGTDLPTKEKPDKTCSGLSMGDFGTLDNNYSAIQVSSAQNRCSSNCDAFRPVSIQSDIQNSLYIPNHPIPGGYIPLQPSIQPQSNPCGLFWSPDYATSESQTVNPSPLQFVHTYIPPYYLNHQPSCQNLWTTFQQNGILQSSLNSSYVPQLDGFANAVHGCPIFTGQPSSLLSSATTSNNLRMPCSNLESSENSISSRGKTEKVTSGSIYVYNIGNLTSERQLWELFSRFGAISNVSIPKDMKTRFARNFGFVTFNTVYSAQCAINVMNGASYAGRRLQVSFRRPKINVSKSVTTKRSSEETSTDPSFMEDRVTLKENSVEPLTNGYYSDSHLELAEQIKVVTLDDTTNNVSESIEHPVC